MVISCTEIGFGSSLALDRWHARRPLPNVVAISPKDSVKSRYDNSTWKVQNYEITMFSNQVSTHTYTPVPGRMSQASGKQLRPHAWSGRRARWTQPAKRNQVPAAWLRLQHLVSPEPPAFPASEWLSGRPACGRGVKDNRSVQKIMMCLLAHPEGGLICS